MWQTYNFIGDVEDTSTLRVELTGNGTMPHQHVDGSEEALDIRGGTDAGG